MASEVSSSVRSHIFRPYRSFSATVHIIIATVASPTLVRLYHRESSVINFLEARGPQDQAKLREFKGQHIRSYGTMGGTLASPMLSRLYPGKAPVLILQEAE